MKTMMLAIALLFEVVSSSSLDDLKCCPQESSTLKCGGNGCDDLCCDCEGTCNIGLSLPCSIATYLDCAATVAKCYVTCCGGDCISEPACRECFGNLYEKCKHCFGITYKNIPILAGHKSWTRVIPNKTIASNLGAETVLFETNHTAKNSAAVSLQLYDAQGQDAGRFLLKFDGKYQIGGCQTGFATYVNNLPKITKRTWTIAKYSGAEPRVTVQCNSVLLVDLKMGKNTCHFNSPWAITWGRNVTEMIFERGTAIYYAFGTQPVAGDEDSGDSNYEEYSHAAPHKISVVVLITGLLAVFVI